MFKKSLIAALAALSMGLSRAEAGPLSFDGFSAGTNGWTIYDNYGLPAPSPTWMSTGGVPGGYLFARDYAPSTYYFSAPSSWLGNKSAWYGETFSYDLMDWGEGVRAPGYGDLWLHGNGLWITYDFGTLPGGSWDHYSALLKETSGWAKKASGWPAPTQAELQGVLANLDAVHILADYIQGTDNTGLDNVRVSGGNRVPSGNVPEPGTYAMIAASGLAGLAFLRRRM